MSRVVTVRRAQTPDKARTRANVGQDSQELIVRCRSMIVFTSPAPMEEHARLVVLPAPY